MAERANRMRHINEILADMGMIDRQQETKMRIVITPPATVEHCAECGHGFRKVVEIADVNICHQCILRAAELIVYHTRDKCEKV